MPETSGNDGNGDAREENSKEELEEELAASLQRLSSLAAGKERTVFSREAQDIIDDIERLLNAVSSTMETRNREGSGNRRKRNHTYGRNPMSLMTKNDSTRMESSERRVFWPRFRLSQSIHKVCTRPGRLPKKSSSLVGIVLFYPAFIQLFM